MSVQMAGEADIKELEVPAGSKVLYLERVRFANGTPVVLEYNFLPAKFISLINEPLENVSLYGLLESKFSIDKLDSVIIIGITNTDTYQSKLLNIKKGTPVLFLHEIVYDASQKPVHRTRQYINGDRFKYIVR